MRTFVSQPQTIQILILLVVLSISACRPNATLPDRSSPHAHELGRTFYIALAALEVGHDVEADSKLAQFTQLAPAEPAGWANWGLLALRQKNFDVAAERLERARSLATDNSNIYYLVGLLESSRGKTPEAIAALRKSVELDPKNLIATYKLAEEVEREGNEDEFQRLMQQILATQPDNIAALVELARVAAKRNDTATLNSAVAKITARSSSWPAEVQEQVNGVVQAASGGDLRNAATRTSFLRNVLVRVPEYRRDLAAIKPPPGEEAMPFRSFLKLETPVFKTAAPDLETKFEPRIDTDKTDKAEKADWVGAIALSGTVAPVVATATAREVRLASGATLPFPGGPNNTPSSRDGVLQIDFSYDFKTDLVLAGAGGVRLFRQDSPSSFVDVTAETKLPAPVINGDYNGAWAADIEADGDLDIVLGARRGNVIVLRNNGDGTFTDIQPFAGVQGVTG